MKRKSRRSHAFSCTLQCRCDLCHFHLNPLPRHSPLVLPNCKWPGNCKGAYEYLVSSKCLCFLITIYYFSPLFPVVEHIQALPFPNGSNSKAHSVISSSSNPIRSRHGYSLSWGLWTKRINIFPFSNTVVEYQQDNFSEHIHSERGEREMASSHWSEMALCRCCEGPLQWEWELLII